MSASGESDALSWALDEIADGWTLLLLREAFLGARRFSDYEARLDAPKSRVAERLSRLVDHGLLERRRYQSRPERFEYVLAPRGLALYPLALALLAWGAEHTDAPAPELVHRSCGRRLQVSCVCGGCGNEVTGGDLSWHPAVAGHLTSDRRRRIPGVATQRNEAVGAAIAAIGDRWSGGLVALLFAQPATYSQLRARLGASTNILADRLARLLDAELVTKSDGVRGLYRLTEQGLALAPAFVFLSSWASVWAPADIDVLHVAHHSCGHGLGAVAACSACGEPVDPRSVAVQGVS